MLKRECSFPECPRSLENLPPNFELCTRHQIDFRLLEQNVTYWLEGRKLPQKDLWFIFVHPLGCKGFELAGHLNIVPRTLLSRIRIEQIKAYKIPRHKPKIWFIPLNEMVRVIDLNCNWISVSKAIGMTKSPVSCETLSKYVKKGQFGPYQEDTAGHGQTVLLRNVLPTLAEKCRVLKQEGIANRGFKACFRKRGVISAAMMAKRLSSYTSGQHLLHASTVHCWMKKGYISYRNSFYKVITEKDFQQFVTKAIEGQFPIKAHYVTACRLYLEGQKTPPDQ